MIVSACSRAQLLDCGSYSPTSGMKRFLPVFLVQTAADPDRHRAGAAIRPQMVGDRRDRDLPPFGQLPAQVTERSVEGTFPCWSGRCGLPSEREDLDPTEQVGLEGRYDRGIVVHDRVTHVSDG